MKHLILTQEADNSVMNKASESRLTVWNKLINALAVRFKFRVNADDDSAVFSNMTELSEFQPIIGMSSIGCDISAFNEFISMLSSDAKSIALDYVQGVKVSAIARNRGISRCEVVDSLSSLYKLAHC